MAEKIRHLTGFGSSFFGFFTFSIHKSAFLTIFATFWSNLDFFLSVDFEFFCFFGGGADTISYKSASGSIIFGVFSGFSDKKLSFYVLKFYLLVERGAWFVFIVSDIIVIPRKNSISESRKQFSVWGFVLRRSRAEFLPYQRSKNSKKDRLGIVFPGFIPVMGWKPYRETLRIKK